jgi:AraC family transcriptional regulator of adaptative response/methylated-DNA-[protein]-cysteine methyltransferase
VRKKQMAGQAPLAYSCTASPPHLMPVSAMPAAPPPAPLPAAAAAAPGTLPSFASEEARWLALQTRDARADAHFVYAVRSTGIYAAPSRARRLPRRANVEFFASPAAAEAAGYRASRHPQARHAEAIALACRWLEQADLPLSELAERLALSPYHLHRLFKAQTGLTPKAYGAAQRAQRLRAELATATHTASGRSAQLLAPTRVTDAIYDAGYQSSSRVYQASDGLLGMRPGDYRARGRGQDIRFAVADCTLGALLVARSTRGLCAIALGDDAEQLVRELQDQFAHARLLGADADFEQWVAAVVGLVECPALGLQLPLDIRGSAFQQRVWRALQQLAPGQTTSYSALAQAIGAPGAARAVAQACAANKLALAVPCHRVVRQDGSLSGYRWGVARKRELLAREAQAVQQATARHDCTAPQASPLNDADDATVKSLQHG